AACETVFSKLKAENRPDEEWIDYYNHRRIQTKLGNLTPLQYEARLAA
ncbi:IS3 family transposase, partial [Limosilactobacillus mucosae]